MRIAYFTSSYPRATDTFIQREVIGLRASGVEVLTCALRQPEGANNVSPLILNERKQTTYFLPASPVKLIKLNFKYFVSATSSYFKTLHLAFKTRRPGVKGSLYQLFYFQEALLLANYLQQNNVQHVHNHFGDSSGMVTMLASQLSGVGYSVTFHGPHIFFEPTLLALREKVKYAKFIVCISNYCKSQMMLFSNVEDWHKLKIVHCGVDVDKYFFDDKPVDSQAAGPVKLLYVGRLAAEKGVPVLLKSLIDLKNEGYQFHLTLLGDGPERASLESEVDKHGLTEMVFFGGFASQETVRETLLASDVFILPSFAEGVPVSLMEAMACGIPVIGTNVGGVTELIEHGVSGMVVAPSDEQALKSAIFRYIKHPELRETVRSAARETIESDFNFKIEVSKLEQLIREQVQS
ncbi:glycosyltransferase family 4 protein [Methylophilus sp. 3sh_L]|uniref:glycosyltransferase family 4 protein n=1 Tax=Methylophilus sp. 3sh_L TaxID=3377114 RepID=UPI00398F377F